METTYNFHGYEIPIDLMVMTGGGPDTLESISDAHINGLKRYVGLAAGQSALEIGCGIGRDAIPLIDILGPSGSYLGVDITRPSIEWCQQHITAKHKNFTFHHFDVKDQFYNKSGKLLTRDCTLPAQDESIDLVILQSVFTHMFPDDIKHYLKEFRRVLKKGGLIFATVFLYSDEILASARQPNRIPSNLRFEHETTEGFRINDLLWPTGAVALTEKFFDGLLEDSGLFKVRALKGFWSGFYSDPDPYMGQDALILSK
jgi:SAM-dependent methyltransferase